MNTKETISSIGVLCPSLDGAVQPSKRALKRARRKAREKEALERGKEWLKNHDEKVKERNARTNGGYVAVIHKRGVKITPYRTIDEYSLTPTSGQSHGTGEYCRNNKDTRDFYRYEFSGKAFGVRHLKKGRLDRPYTQVEKR